MNILGYRLHTSDVSDLSEKLKLHFISNRDFIY